MLKNTKRPQADCSASLAASFYLYLPFSKKGQVEAVLVGKPPEKGHSAALGDESRTRKSALHTQAQSLCHTNVLSFLANRMLHRDGVFQE